jgi:alcohol dehydrogenase class IV
MNQTLGENKMPAPYYFQIPTQIVYGRDSLRQLGDLARKFNVSKAQVITDPGVASSGVLEQVLDQLKKSGIEWTVFDQVEVNPTVQTADSAADQYKREDCDGIIALGGGSPLDAGKAVGVLASNPGKAVDYLGVDKVKAPSAPVIAIPTTAGTAAEITDVTVLTDPAKKAKIGLRSAYVAPRVALLDPVLTLGLPPIPTRDSGLDALTHAVESFICVNAWAGSDALALKAIELIGKYLRTAVHNGKDLEARDGMLTASLLAGMAFHNTKLTLVHAITGPLGGAFNLPHGAINAIILPHAMEFMLPGAIEKYTQIAVALGEPVEGLPKRLAAEKAVSAVKQLSQDVGLPAGLSFYGVTDEALLPLSKTIAGSFMVPLAPRVANADEILAVCRASL